MNAQIYFGDYPAMAGDKDKHSAKPKGPRSKEAGKKNRLADALRQNLTKRKVAKKAASAKNAETE